MNATLRIAPLLVAALAIVQIPFARADQPAELRRNPFEKPAILAEPMQAKGLPATVPDVPPALNGTLVSLDAPMAILDGELLRLGDEHAGYRLVAVNEGAATLEKQGRQIQILIKDPAANTATRRIRR